MSGLFNRLKSRKAEQNTPSKNENSPASVLTFDEEGFLCPICHQKFNDHTQLATHYTQTHAQESVTEKEDINSFKRATTPEEIQNPMEEVVILKQQFTASEQTRILLATELRQEKQRADDSQEELRALQKQLHTTQAKVAKQSQEIGNLKATKDVYDAQLAIFSDELLNTQKELKGKQQQVATLCDDLIPRSTHDDVDVLKRELITVQQCMNGMSLEKEEEIEELRSILLASYQNTQRLENLFNKNTLIFDEMINKDASEMESGINDVKQFVRLTRQRKEKIETVMKYMRNRFKENQSEIKQLKQTNIQFHNDLEQRNQLNEKLTNDLQIEQKQTNSYRNQIESLTNEIHELEKTLNEIKQEKNEFIQTKMDGDQDNERQNLLRQITQEKDQFEQQTKDLRIQIKQITQERQQIQDEFNHISKQLTQITNEKNQLQNEQARFNNDIGSLKQQLKNVNKDKKRQVTELNNELSVTREQYTSINMKLENVLRETNEYNDNQKREIDRMKNDLTDQINRLEREKNELKQTMNQREEKTNETKLQLNTMEKEKDQIQQQLQTKQQTIEELQKILSRLHIKLDQKETYMNRLSIGMRRSVDIAHKTREYLQQNMHTSQMNILATIEQAEQELRSKRAETLKQIHGEFTTYLTIVHTITTDSKIKFEKQTEGDKLKLIEQEKQLDKIKNEHDKFTRGHNEQKQKSETQISELKKNLLQVSESLSAATQIVDVQREKFEKQITSLERELESRTKKHEMQLTALRENLASVRTELKNTNGKIATLDQIKAEKADLETRLMVNQDERHVLLERSLGSESKNDKLIFENGQLTKKNTDLESALQEIAREFQVLQIQTNKLKQRRWLNDDDIHACMKCTQTFSVTQRKHHCRHCGNIFCDNCSSNNAIIAASSKKQQRVCDQCYKDLTS